MQFLDLTLPSLPENLALDEALLLHAEAGSLPEFLGFWEWLHPTLILGAGCCMAEDVVVDTCRRDEILIYRRSSGGGTVLLGSGCLCYSLVLAYERSPAVRQIRSSYQYVL